MRRYQTTQVFIPGGLPSVTYIPRTTRNLEARLRAVENNLCKLVAVTGPTKSGKTVLANKVLPRSRAVWIDGGTVTTEEEIWREIIDQLDGFTEVRKSEAKSTATHLDAEVGGKAKIPLIAEGAAKVSTGIRGERGYGTTQGRSVPPRTAAVRQLRSVRKPLVIDDFHYLDREIQGRVVRALKPLIFEGIPIVLIAIPHRRYDAIRVEREITGRIDTIEVPAWGVGELVKIPEEGFPYLNIESSIQVRDRLACEAYGSPHLIQEFCREVATSHGVEETASSPVVVSKIDDALFKKVAVATGRVVYERLARGPRQRSDRMQRKLHAGGTKDIYEVVLLALSEMAPGMTAVPYEQLRAAIRQVLSDNIPQAHEVTRVLEKMAEISAADESSTPVIDWDREEQTLHITDPFFAFFLKWGQESS